MLTRLLVKNFLLIRHAELNFSPRLNVLTGETGTGKSLLLDALGLALGGRGKSDWIGSGGDDLLVEAVFRADRAAAKLASSLGIAAAGEELILTRQIRRRGGSRCFVNGQRVLQRGLQRLGAQLVEIHGQREEERFRLPEVQRDLLDLFGDHREARRKVRDLYRELRTQQERVAEHGARLRRLESEEEWIRFQLGEIEQLRPEEGELEALRERVRGGRRQRESEEWLELAETLLNGRDGAVLESAETLDARCSALPDEPPWDALRTEVHALRSAARDLHRSLQRLRRDAHEEAGDLHAAEERLGQLEGLQRKHRKTVDEIIAVAGEMRTQLEELEAGSALREELEGKLGECRRALERAAARLRRLREKAADSLSTALAREISGLGMKGCALRVAVEPLPGSGEGSVAPSGSTLVGAKGSERVRFLVQTNPGAGYRPLGEIASGGEMARMALALRVVLGDRGRSLLTVFDEIDAGLGATAARAVAARLQGVARHRQVLLVSHLPGIAASADRHFLIGKAERAGRNWVEARPVEGAARVREIARMLSGDAGDRRAREHAEALLAGSG